MRIRKLSMAIRIRKSYGSLENIVFSIRCGITLKRLTLADKECSIQCDVKKNHFYQLREIIISPLF